jgi:hypothetical protein
MVTAHIGLHGASVGLVPPFPFDPVTPYLKLAAAFASLVQL